MEALPKQEDGYLFPASFREVNRKTHWTNFRSWCKSVGIDPGTRHPHSLRHMRATVGLASNEGELRLQLSLGHAGAEMTKHYAQQAMRLKKALGHWGGVMRFRDPVEVARLSTSASKRLANEA
jgi:integrase